MTPHYILVSHIGHQWIERPGGPCRLPSRYSYYDETQKVVEELNRLVDRINRLEDGILKQNQEIEQTCGKVLGYPWFKDDQKNFHGATEKDGVCVGDHVAETIVSELAKRHTEALAKIKRLEQAGDALKASGYFGGWADAVNKWIKVREDKP